MFEEIFLICIFAFMIVCVIFGSRVLIQLLDRAIPRSNEELEKQKVNLYQKIISELRNSGKTGTGVVEKSEKLKDGDSKVEAY